MYSYDVKVSPCFNMSDDRKKSREDAKDAKGRSGASKGR